MEKIRVGLRGAAGLLGSRLAVAIARSGDMRLEFGVVKNDATLARMIESARFGGSTIRDALPRRMYVEESPQVIEKLNSQMGERANFFPIEELNLSEACDIVVDAASPGRGHVLEGQYQKFPGRIILQDGEYPRGRLIAPPMVARQQGGNRYRQGGCFLSGVAPVLSAFQDVASSVRVHLVMQYDGRDSDFTITERINTFRVADAYAPRMEDELTLLFPKMEIVIESVIQIPGMLHYAVTLEIETRALISKEEAMCRLTTLPRVRVMPDSVMSTYEVNLARAIDDRIPPILVFGGSLRTSPRGQGSVVRMKLALYYRTLAVLPNIDAIRILALKMEPKQAMRKTDSDMGFSDPDA